MIQSRQNYLCQHAELQNVIKLTYRDHQSGGCEGSERMLLSDTVGQNDLCNSGNKHEKRLPRALQSRLRFSCYLYHSWQATASEEEFLSTICLHISDLPNQAVRE